MSLDVAVVGSPFADLVFAGLPRLPQAGQEIVGTAFRMVPGGSAMQAIGLARLGVAVALVSPRGNDAGGRAIADVLADEGVAWVGPDADATPTTAVLIAPEGTAMATATAHDEPAVEDVAGTGASLVVLSLGRAHLRPAATPACFVSGSIEIERNVGLPEGSEIAEDVLVVNVREAEALTGADDPERAARALARGRRAAVVTMGPEGAVGVEDDLVARAAAPDVEVADVTGAGDLFVAALVWARRRGLDLEAALAWSCLAASLSVREVTALDGAPRLDELLDRGRALGLSPP